MKWDNLENHCGEEGKKPLLCPSKEVAWLAPSICLWAWGDRKERTEEVGSGGRAVWF